jgi:PadR family transcriptional regulator PadR
MLGNLEVLVLLAILRAGSDAYGVTIAAEIEERAERALSLATIHKTLGRLEDKGLVRARLGDPTPVRGGRAKRFYDLTPAGRRELIGSLEMVRRMTPGLNLGIEFA